MHTISPTMSCVWPRPHLAPLQIKNVVYGKGRVHQGVRPNILEGVLTRTVIDVKFKGQQGARWPYRRGHLLFITLGWIVLPP